MSIKLIDYSHEQLIAAYNAWTALCPKWSFESMDGQAARENFNARQTAWDAYCDVRDKLPHGTTHSCKLVREARRTM